MIEGDLSADRAFLRGNPREAISLYVLWSGMLSRKNASMLPREYPDTFQEDDGLENILQSLKQGHMGLNCEHCVQALAVGIKHATEAPLPALKNLAYIRRGYEGKGHTVLSSVFASILTGDVGENRK